MAPPTRPTPPRPPQPRAMDTYGPEVEAAFVEKMDAFFGGHGHDKDATITFTSTFGHFRIETYPNQGNANDIHIVVFFRNKATGQTIETHGTIARRYVELVRNNAAVLDFPIADSLTWRADTRDAVSRFSRYVLHWEQATNGVNVRWYRPYAPGMEAVPARLHDHDPVRKNTLVAYAEAYDIESPGLQFANWKDEPGMGRYAGSISVRAVGMPTQILLHETAGFGDMAIANVREAQAESGGTFFPIPHFCVNNLDDQGRGRVIQFVDVATNVPHGEATNARAVGIEFVNAPIEAFKVDGQGQTIRPLQPLFDLEHSKRGLYVQTKLGGLARLFIPLQFSAEPTAGYYELALPKNRLINSASLAEGIGPEKQKVLFEHDDAVVLKYCKSDLFEHLLTLASTLVTHRLVNGVADLAREEVWKPVVRIGNRSFYIWEHGWLGVQRMVNGRPVVDRYHCIDLREPGVFTHILIGGHADGGAQGLYGYLRLARHLSPMVAMQTLITFLTGEKTPAEVAGFKLEAKVVQSSAGLTPPSSRREKTFKDILEIDDDFLAGLAGTRI